MVRNGEFLKISKSSLRHGTHPSTLHTLLTLVNKDLNHWQDALRGIANIAGTQFLPVSGWLKPIGRRKTNGLITVTFSFINHHKETMADL